MPENDTCTKCLAQTAELNDGLCASCMNIENAKVASSATPGPADATIAPSTPTGRSVSTTLNTVGDYELLGEIARGGMGVVYKARHTKLNRIVALKMILGGQFSSEDELKRFQIEAEAAARLDHPGIIPVYDIGEHDGQPFFAMKHIGGGSLTDQLPILRKRPRAAIHVMSQIAKAVHHAHQRGILHRDLKPANILMDESDEPLITDLGLAKSTANDSNITHTGAVLGTPSYMAPEQAGGNASITTAADIYSLGAIMYELLTGRPPHKGASAIETVMSVLNGTPVLPRKIDSSIDPDLELVCLKCIEREPDKRYSSAAELAGDLDNWLDGESISIKAPSLFQMASRWMKRNQRVAYLVFATLLALTFATPFVIAFFSESTNLDEVYKHFPNETKPFIYSLGRLPGWTGNVAAGFLIIVIWPLIGLLNAMVTQPQTLRAAIGSGVLTSLFCGILFFVGLGWVIITIFNTEFSSEKIRSLGNAVWTPEGITPDAANKAALNVFPGLDKVPESERTQVFLNRAAADQIASSPLALLLIASVIAFLSIPVVYGTMIAGVLLNRRQRLWLVLLRYVGAWIATTIALLTIIVIAIPGSVKDSNGSISFYNLTSILVGIAIVGTCSIIAFLCLRRWRAATEINLEFEKNG